MLSLTELGKRLEETRKQKNLTLDELQTITKIQKRYLKAIEEGNFSIMPGKFYARAFIKQYAEAVDLDPEELFDEFATEIPKTGTEVPSGLSRTQSKQAPISTTSSFLFSLLPKLLVFVLVISVAVFIWWFFMQKAEVSDNTDGGSVGSAVESQQDENVTIVNPDNESDTPPEKEEPVLEPNPEPIPEELPSQQLVQVDQNNGTTPITTYELKGTDQFVIEIVSTGRSYIGIMNGKGKSFYGQELRNGETITYDFGSEQEIELNIGRTLDVTIKINGQAFEYPFPPSEKVHQKIKFLFNKAIQ